jgi:hypothetical protein
MKDYKTIEDMPLSVREPDFAQIAWDLREAVFNRREPQTAKQILSGQNYEMVIKEQDGTLKNTVKDGLCTQNNLKEFITRNPNNYITIAFNHALHEGNDEVIADFINTTGFKEFTITQKSVILAEIGDCFINGKDAALAKLLKNEHIHSMIESASNTEIFELALAVKEGAKKHPEAAKIIQEDNALKGRVVDLVQKANELADFMGVAVSTQASAAKEAAWVELQKTQPSVGFS